MIKHKTTGALVCSNSNVTQLLLLYDVITTLANILHLEITQSLSNNNQKSKITSKTQLLKEEINHEHCIHLLLM